MPSSIRQPSFGILMACLLAACTAGPDFQRPLAPGGGDSYTPAPLPAQTAAAPGPAGQAQRFVPGQDIPAQWWSLFQSPALDQLVRDALARSPGLASAQAALRQADENYRALSGSLLYPEVGAQLGVTREKNSRLEGTGGVLNLYNASVNVSYALDVFGGNKRQLEGLQALVDYRQYQLEAVYLALMGNLVTTAIRDASLRGQLQATGEILDAQQKQLDVIEQQFRFGAIPRATVLLQRNTVAQTRASVPPLEKALALTRHQLSVYAGRLPSEPGMPEFDLASLRLPQDLPVSLPSALVRQRPDIRASEALLQQASAQIGVATAAMYPQITLTGKVGALATSVPALLHASSAVWGVAAGLAQPLFNGGALRARRRAAIAAYEGAAADYRATVLGAFQNVADSLRALEADAAALQQQAEVTALASESLALSTQQFKLGAISYLTLLDAQRTYQQARVGLVQAQAARHADSAALFQALGGGWWNRPALAAVSTATSLPVAAGTD
ncbi:efflux transporter outer membrane subunit [Janthinobacterium sp. FT14W]|uniref:efflux transporter outer membrane subunit n=1 Tax=Janthinobacterium sp. FT14W TaxID=2654253 RepID=UPI00126411CA|nr:efflux transporter outer membrane subunit [Janthinobacterium sp. FT14W]KAB8057857.1 efflux transporter outer membrane subunit [Janthinobacterium sp. FT14W]